MNALESIPPLAWPPAPIHMAIGGAVVALLLLIAWILVARGRSKRNRNTARRDPLDLVAATRLADTGPSSPDSLQGGLRHMPLPDLLQFLAQGRRSGNLEIKSGRREGAIRLVQGMVIHSEYRRTQDLDALFEMLSLETGDFVFTPNDPPDYPVSGREVVDILMLWLSRKDASR